MAADYSEHNTEKPRLSGACRDFTRLLLSITSRVKQYGMLFLLGIHKSAWNAAQMHIKAKLYDARLQNPV